MSSSRSTDAAEEEQAAEPETEDAAKEEAEAEEDAEPETEEAAEASEEKTGESSESEPEGETDGEDAPGGFPVPTEDAGGGPAGTSRGGVSGVVAGAAAVVSAGLGVASLTGTWLSDMMASRQELIGQINSGQTAPPDEQIAKIFGSPWHTTALFNGFFALAAIIMAVAALIISVLSKKGEGSATWVRAVAIGGLALGAIGLVIAGAMWFDVFTELPTVPEPTVPQPAPPG